MVLESSDYLKSGLGGVQAEMAANTKTKKWMHRSKGGWDPEVSQSHCSYGNPPTMCPEGTRGLCAMVRERNAGLLCLDPLPG